MTAATRVESVRGAIGAGHLAAARARRVDGAAGARHAGVAAFHRVLAVRQLAQAVVVGRSASGNAHTVSALVDATHAVSMLPLLLAGGRWRRLAVSQLVIALGLAVSEVLLVGPGGRRVRRGR